MYKKITALLTLAILALGTVPGFAQLGPTFKYKKYYPLWNHKDLSEFMEHSSNWKVKYPNTDTATIYTDGLSHPGSMTHLIYSKKVTNNMEFRASVRMPKTGGANAGMQFRSRCENPAGTLTNNCGGTPWSACGPQADMGDSYSGDIYNGCSGAYINQQTTSQPPRIVNTISTCRAASNFKGVDQWNLMMVRILNDTAMVFINGVSCSKLYLSDPKDQQATTQGLMSLQYENLMVVEWKNLELMNLDGVDSVTTSVAAKTPTKADYELRGGKSSLSFVIPNPGDFSAQVSDVHGKIVKSVQGMGPSSQSLDLRASGLFFVRIESALGKSLHRVLVD